MHSLGRNMYYIWQNFALDYVSMQLCLAIIYLNYTACCTVLDGLLEIPAIAQVPVNPFVLRLVGISLTLSSFRYALCSWNKFSLQCWHCISVQFSYSQSMWHRCLHGRSRDTQLSPSWCVSRVSYRRLMMRWCYWFLMSLAVCVQERDYSVFLRWLGPAL